MILNDRQIKAAVESHSIEISPFDEKQIQPASYDFRVGSQAVTTSCKEKIDIAAKGFLTIEPGDFAVVMALEQISLDAQHVGRFGLRSKFARKGLLATVGPQIDPGFQGRLIVGLTNLSTVPVVLSYRDDFISVEFHRLDQACDTPYSNPDYQGKVDLGPEEIEAVTLYQRASLTGMQSSLDKLGSDFQQLSAKLEGMSTDLEHKIELVSNELKSSTQKTSFWLAFLAIAVTVVPILAAVIVPIVTAFVR